MKKLLFLFMFAPLLMASTCESEDDPIVCTQEFVYGLHVTVLDSATGQPLVENVIIKAADGSYLEDLVLVPGLEYSFVGAGERTGTYIITVTKPGYQTYVSSPIVVTANVCHVNPQSLTVNLVAD